MRVVMYFRFSTEADMENSEKDNYHFVKYLQKRGWEVL